MANRDKIVFEYLLYDYIEYNGYAYYIAENQHLSFPSGKKGSPVYLIYEGDKIYYESCQDAVIFAGYEGAEKEIYIFFDSAIYIREDYRQIDED